MTKERLQRYQALKKEQAQIEAELARLDAELTAPRAQQLTGMPRSGGNGNPLEDLVARKVDLCGMYYDKIREIDGELLAIETAIEGLEPTERRLLRYRYIDGLKWEEICVAMAYSWRRVHQIHSEALIKLKMEGAEKLD